MRLRISSELHRRLLYEALASPNAEICGLLIGDEDVDQIIPTNNVSDDPATSFEIDPNAHFAAIRAERAGLGKLLGYYHSHPAGPPMPSARDSEQATVDGRVWIIIGEGLMTAWTMGTANKFNAIELQITD